MAAQKNQGALPDFIDLTPFDDNLQIQEEGMSVDIVNPAGKATGLKIVIYGPDSTRAEQAVKELAAEIEKDSAADGDLGGDTPEAQKKRSIAYLAKITKGWNVPIGADRLTYSEENARSLYAKYPFIKDQVQFKADRRSLFIKS
ncbi:hypothetical protein LAV84_18250 [Rhizobium sp. VS19-DR104.2]|uniref:hypothetical protein n=1 Tax=unclassified Rhizobium TaxID=2613769 RepID=UPI001CC33645|nr:MULTISPECIES: hypothetical protein [unclassified Rhizobium]MBZ5761590.1 hypothetical protein [Rhizobium sp. VS19-DR96]MBZ5767538.1 hypothetical protein [Rhizobium sp. VS19-DR129.2]MBZ5775012.1 hypothetical protein [Rhizobium sp. VS19-DRK62.2]MBZ5786021.1 hypothetical protein [Rhizobium sp. VS19-DR121]MBZ5803449.1 hypothetical protein [Rhizobium sp. VS19-DR181]